MLLDKCDENFVSERAWSPVVGVRLDANIILFAFLLYFDWIAERAIALGVMAKQRAGGTQKCVLM